MKKPKLFIDSGAYSAMTKGAEIDLKRYVEFLKAEPHDVAAGLDVIGDAEGTHKNQRAMEALGVQPIPTFHMGEPFSYLRDMVDQYDYIAMGFGGRTYSRTEILEWLDMVWDEYLTDADGLPVVRVHGFAATGDEIMRRYPWFSVDSTSWIMAAANGSAIIHHEGALVAVPVSSGGSGSDRRDNHLDSMTPASREAAVAALRATGHDPEQLAASYLPRFYCNADAYVSFARSCVYKPFKRAQRFLFASPKPTKRPVPAWDHLTFYFAGNPGSTEVTRVLMQDRGYNRLLSYWYIQDNGALFKHFTTAKDIINAYQPK